MSETTNEQMSDEKISVSELVQSCEAAYMSFVDTRERLVKEMNYAVSLETRMLMKRLDKEASDIATKMAELELKILRFYKDVK